MDDQLSLVERVSIIDVARAEPELALGAMVMMAVFAIAAVLSVKPIEFVSRAWRAVAR